MLKLKSFLSQSLLVLGIFCSNSYAQESKRIEFPATGNENSNLVISLGKEGVLMVSKASKEQIFINKIDTSLASGWQKVVDMEQNLTFIDHTIDNRDVYLLMGKDGSTSFQLYKISTGIGLVQKFNIETLSRFELSLFKVFNQTVYFGGSVKEEPVLLMVSLEKPVPKVIAGNFKSTSSIQSLDFDYDNELLLVSYTFKENKKNQIMLRKYSGLGKVIEQIILEPSDEYSFLTGKVFRGQNGSEYMVGNYGLRGAGTNGTPISQGIYISKIENSQVVFLNYYNFTDFKNFFNYMSVKQQEKIEKQIEKRKDKGKELHLNYRVLVHDIKEVDNKILLSADVFIPEYRTNNNYYGSPFGYSTMYSPSSFYFNPLNRYYGLNSWAWNPYSYGNARNNQIFDGFRYTHAIITQFDEAGKLLWDNSISYNNFKTFELKQKLIVQPIRDDVYKLAYTNQGKLNIQVIEEDKLILAPRAIAIQTENEVEKIKETAYENADFWYDNHFLVYGEQKVAGEKNRKVFFINKISF